MKTGKKSHSVVMSEFIDPVQVSRNNMIKIKVIKTNLF